MATGIVIQFAADLMLDMYLELGRTLGFDFVWYGWYTRV